MITEEDKKLLLKDLCARLPYGVICKGICRDLDVIKDDYMNTEVRGPLTNIGYDYGTLGLTKECKLSTINPYLRPMSSMTEEERAEYFTLKHRDKDRVDNIILISEASALMDWLNKEGFDYYGLIEKGLALEAPEGMYNTKTE